MFGISGEHLLILGIVLIFFGPRRLPELGNTLGKAIRNFKDALSGVEEAKFRRIDETGRPPAAPLVTSAPPTTLQPSQTVAGGPDVMSPAQPTAANLEQSAATQVAPISPDLIMPSSTTPLAPNAPASISEIASVGAVPKIDPNGHCGGGSST